MIFFTTFEQNTENNTVMKKLFVLLAMLPLLFSCDLDGYIDDMMSLDPHIKNSIGYWAENMDQTNEEAKALVAVHVEKPAFAGKKGDNLKFQVALDGDKWGGKPDKLDIHYYITGKMTIKSADECTIKIDSYTYLNETWKFTKEIKKQNDEDIEWIHLTSGSKSFSLRYHFTED